nr:hypothetical protein CFP56_13251 [Quercus suber]
MKRIASRRRRQSRHLRLRCRHRPGILGRGGSRDHRPSRGRLLLLPLRLLFPRRRASRGLGLRSAARENLADDRAPARRRGARVARERGAGVAREEAARAPTTTGSAGVSATASGCLGDRGVSKRQWSRAQGSGGHTLVVAFAVAVAATTTTTGAHDHHAVFGRPV